jgi:hypothetical protein
MAGLLGGDDIDPRTQGLLAMGLGMLNSRGNFGMGLGQGGQAGLAAFNEAQQSQAKRTLQDAQLQEALQQISMHKLALEQQKRTFDLQTPFMEMALARAQGRAAPAMPQQGQPQQPMPSMMPGSGALSQSQNAGVQQGVNAAASPQPAQRTGSMFPGVSDDVAFASIGTGGIGKIPDLISKYNEPTELMKTMAAAGIDPQSPQGQQLIQANLAKTNYVAPLNARPGSILRDPFSQKPIAFNPHIQDNGVPVFDAGGVVTGMREMPGTNDLIASQARAKAGGEGSVLPYAGLDARGNPLPVTNRTAVATQGAPGMKVTADAQLTAIKESLPLMVAELAKTPPGLDRDSLQKEIGRAQNALLKRQPFSQTTTASPIYAAAAPGTDTNAANNANELSKKWTTQIEAHQQAQTTNSYLDAIVEASKKATTGPFADKAAFINALIAPLSTKADENLTEKQLLDKYSNQIVSRLGQGGMGTDAARAIIQSAYPNAKMTKGAIEEASANIKGANAMTQARTELLRPIAADRSPDANARYDAAATAFDKAADPRIYQLQNMTEAQAKLFLFKLSPREKDDLRSRSAALKAMGAI